MERSADELFRSVVIRTQNVTQRGECGHAQNECDHSQTPFECAGRITLECIWVIHTQLHLKKIQRMVPCLVA